MSVTGQPGGPPTKAGTSIGDITGGLFTLAGITSALYHRERTGRGLRVDVSMLDGQIAILESAIMRYVTSGQVPVSLGNRHPSIAPFQPYATADRPLVIAAGNNTLFARLCRALDSPSLATDPRFVSNRERLKNVDALEKELETILRQRKSAEWAALLAEAGVPCSVIHTVADAVEHPQVRARNMIVQAGELRMAGNPIKLSEFPDLPTRRAAPLLDADGARIRQEMSQVP
jgi:CoA:oxalate CoA-transferase